MQQVYVVCYDVQEASRVFENSLKTYIRMLGEEKVTAQLRYRTILTPDTRVVFISKNVSRAVAMGKTIHNVVFYCGEWLVLNDNPELYRELLVRRSRQGFPFEFTLAHTLFDMEI